MEPIESHPNRIQFNNCFYCDKKLKLIHYKCKCKNLYCVKHRLPQSHDCKFDFKRKIDKI